MPNVNKQETKYITAAREKHVRQFENNWDRLKVKCSPQSWKADWETVPTLKKTVGNAENPDTTSTTCQLQISWLSIIQSDPKRSNPVCDRYPNVSVNVWEIVKIFKFCLKSKLKFKFWLVRLGVTAAGADRSSTNNGSASCPCAGWI